jgi:Zn-dependent protease
MTANPLNYESGDAVVCPRCGMPLRSEAELACSSCGALVHAAELEHLSGEARWQEQFNPSLAINLWQRCLALLPPSSRQHAVIENEIARLEQLPAPRLPVSEPGTAPVVASDSLMKGIAKTGISMIISIAIYAYLMGWPAAIGFVLLIFVHEMGHVVANLTYGLPASAPVFIPFLGAVINLRKNPPNAKVEAIVGIAGPIAGTIGALACFAWYLANGSQFALELAAFGFWINLFNLLPVPPLDGGRVAAAISPWIWILGLVGMGWMVMEDLKTGHQVGIFVLILIFALPRIVKTLKPKGRSGQYYAIGRMAPLVIGGAYLALLVLLVTLRMYCESRLRGAGFL